ncbi:transcription repressor OFP8 [Impatiens glandulifera]|uniref:transcription repressor OFP8 n=1 Tax=Impatiens glandulifera TaxID=253017 RepID=UPI001FB192F4|nr:transcription repressor OFP8 [Impatiens glandulifera]
MENPNQTKLKHRISRMFRSSFRSCKSVTDVIERPPASAPSAANKPLIELFSPKIKPCRRKKWSKVVETVDQNCSLAKDRIFLNKKVSNRRPISPISPPEIKQRKRRQRNQRKKRPSSYMNLDKYYEFLSSEEDDDHREEEEEEEDGKTTLFSSRSLSSDSSESFQMMRRKGDNKVKNSLVVVKKSKDPYNDFRNSMVEMIVEKQIFAGRDLENLLQTFLSLNSSHHHKVIIEVYTEIWETLFSNCS